VRQPPIWPASNLWQLQKAQLRAMANVVTRLFRKTCAGLEHNPSGSNLTPCSSPDRGFSCKFELHLPSTCRDIDSMSRLRLHIRSTSTMRKYPPDLCLTPSVCYQYRAPTPFPILTECIKQCSSLHDHCCLCPYALPSSTAFSCSCSQTTSPFQRQPH
jgi:hypothetical protein